MRIMKSKIGMRGTNGERNLNKCDKTRHHDIINRIRVQPSAWYLSISLARNYTRFNTQLDNINQFCNYTYDSWLSSALSTTLCWWWMHFIHENSFYKNYMHVIQVEIRARNRESPIHTCYSRLHMPRQQAISHFTKWTKSQTTGIFFLNAYEIVFPSC